MIQPMGRSFVSYKFDPPEKRNYNPQGANAGGEIHQTDLNGHSTCLEAPIGAQQAASQACCMCCQAICLIVVDQAAWASCQRVCVLSASASDANAAAGKQRVYNNGQLHWPNGKFGICGDSWDASPKPLEQAGRITGEPALMVPGGVPILSKRRSYQHGPSC